MKAKNHLNSRMNKIKFLQNIKEGKATIQELMPIKLEFWTGCDSEPGTYINEDTSEKMTAAELQTRKKVTGNKILLFIQMKSTDEPIKWQ